MPLGVESESKRESKPGVKAGRAEVAEAKTSRQEAKRETRRKIEEDARRGAKPSRGESHKWRADKNQEGQSFK